MHLQHSFLPKAILQLKKRTQQKSVGWSDHESMLAILTNWEEYFIMFAILTNWEMYFIPSQQTTLILNF